MTKYLVIASSKGGMGKTTTAINLGTALTIFGRDVIVVDCNFSAPNISLYLGAPNISTTLHDVLDNDKQITDALYMHSMGLKIIPASPSLKDNKKINHDKLNKLLKDLSGKADFVIIDSSEGMNEDAINSIKLGDEILVVSTPELPAIGDALRTIKLAKDLGKKVKGIILTRVYEDELELSKKQVEAILETPVIAMIPEDETMREAVKIKNPVTHTHPSAPCSKSYKKLASELLGEKYVESVEKEDSLMDYAMKRFGLK